MLAQAQRTRLPNVKQLGDIATAKPQVDHLRSARVRINGQEPPSDVEWRKHIALLSYLAFSPDRTRTRKQIIAMLWPETTDQRARHSLNEAVRRLRGSLGSARIRSTGSGETLTLSGERLTVDALGFDRTADSRRAIS